MSTSKISADELIKRYRDKNVSRVKLAFADLDGVHRGKYISLDKFASIAAGTSGFCDCVLGWDVNDQLYDNASFTGWHTAFPDAKYCVDLTTERSLPDEDNCPLFIVEFVGEENGLHPICPRNLLRRILQKADTMGFSAHMAFEYEFFIFDETPQTLREKNYQNLTPLSPGNFGYSVLRNSSLSDLFHEFMDYCEAMDFPLEGLHCETGPGVWEAAITVDNALKATDKAALFKTFSKTFFNKRGLVATFMAKWSMDYPGQSGHIHQSLTNGEGKGLFHDTSNPHEMSTLMRQYVAGQQKYLKPFLSLCAPTINSYTRLVKGAWAPTAAAWGVDNRTTALRVITGTEKSQRVEFRIGPADANPYLIAAASLGAGLLGIEEELDPGEPLEGNAYEQESELPPERQLASNLRDAIRDLEGSAEAKALFGDEFVNHYIATRDWEVREHERHVTDWQMQRYFEII
tara:strand:+ start:901 stop:2280 length:1380 start_codon:yes stop_codon:yes gene_type:complete